MPCFSCVLAALLVVVFSGCGGTQPVKGGTTGVLRVGNELFSDIQVTFHRVDGASTVPVGFGVTGIDGTFQLMTNGAGGPLWLMPGQYVCTLESAGAPVQIPKAYTEVKMTPLKVTWTENSANAELETPALKPLR